MQVNPLEILGGVLCAVGVVALFIFVISTSF
jgi:hypothetical protein